MEIQDVQKETNLHRTVPKETKHWENSKINSFSKMIEVFKSSESEDSFELTRTVQWQNEILSGKKRQERIQETNQEN